MGEANEGSVISYAMMGGLYLGGLYIVRDLLEMFVYTNVVSFGGVCILSLLAMLSFAFTLYIVIRGTNIYKAEVLKENVSYFRVLNYGFYLFFFASMVYSVYLFLCLTVFNPELLSTQKSFYDSVFTQMETMDGASTQMLSSLKEFFNKEFSQLVSQTPKEMTMNSLFGETSYGFFFCLVTSIFLSKKIKE